MAFTTQLSLLLIIALAFYTFAKRSVTSARDRGELFHSLPNYYGLW